jgi:hypothetical protein
MTPGCRLGLKGQPGAVSPSPRMDEGLKHLSLIAVLSNEVSKS